MTAPRVALESTVYSQLGLPSPANAEALTASMAAVEAAGAEPLVTAVLDGAARVGVGPDEHDRILGARRKVAERDLPVAIAQRWPVGVTTVSASLALAADAGIEVFATGGIGGVHRGAERTGDISADLGAIARHRVVTVCAGAKAFLDLPRTLEHLETLSVPVLGYRTDTFPAFWSASSGLPVPHRVESVEEIAAVHRAARTGVLVAVPIPDEHHLDVGPVIEAALDEVGGTGPEVTPLVLERIAEATDGASVQANIALVANNAAVAGQIARELSTPGRR